MTDFLMGACWTLLCVLVGALIAFVLIAVLGDRPGDPRPPEPPDEPPIDPTPEELESWLEEHTIHELPQIDLRGKKVHHYVEPDLKRGWK